MKNLKNLIFLLSVFFLTPLFSSQEEAVFRENVKQSKIYVEMNDILFNENGITLDISSEVHHGTRALRCDSGGYYVLSSDEYWICPRCGYSNSGTYNGQLCSRCQWPLWDDKRGR